MITLGSYRYELVRKVTPVCHKLLREGAFYLPDNFLFSALGARVCYASEPITQLLSEDLRIKDPEKRVEFLTRLAKVKHYSVFSHSPIILEEGVSEDEKQVLSQLFKTFVYNPKGWNYLCLNLRHLTELVSLETLHKYLTLNHSSFLHLTKELSGDRQVHLLTFEDPLRPYGWLVVVAEGFSRVFSHQFVRHTWLNFNQRSHRYTEVDGYYLPQSVQWSITFELLDHVDGVYNQLISDGVHREDARYITPQASRTTVLASGPLLAWQDFLEKRKHPKAQSEIREFAQVVDELILESPYKYSYAEMPAV